MMGSCENSRFPHPSQALPWQAAPSETSTDHTTPWDWTVHGIRGVCMFLAIILAENASARAAVQQDGSLSAAIQRVRDLQPTPEHAAGWPVEREALLQEVLFEPASSRGSRRRRAGGGAAAAEPKAGPDAGAVAAAERAMQELLAEEPLSDASNQSSKAATKRARKKAAKQKAAAATADAQAEHLATNPAADVSAAGNQEAGNKAVPAPTQPVAADAVPQPVGHPNPEERGVECLSAQESAASTAAAESDWWRCPLSGSAMRDPVLYGSEGHSFEREALEQWLAANPGVHPLSRQPLVPGEGNVVPNHALRNMIQQLQLG